MIVKLDNAMRHVAACAGMLFAGTQFTMIGAKFGGRVDWSWWVVLTPTLATLASGVLFLVSYTWIFGWPRRRPTARRRGAGLYESGTSRPPVHGPVRKWGLRERVERTDDRDYQ